MVAESAPPTKLDIEFYGEEVAARYAHSGGSGLPAERVWPGLAVSNQDIAVGKTGPSAFFPGRCSLHDELQARHVDTVLIAGTVANVCCESTARDARNQGLRVIMVADAISAPTDAMLNATLTTIYRSFGDVRTTPEIQSICRNNVSATQQQE